MSRSASLSAATVHDIVKRDDVRGAWPEQLSPAMVSCFGAGFARLLEGKGAAHPCVVLGYDARHGSADLAAAFARGFHANGGQVVDLGLCSTEHVYYMTGRYEGRYAGGAMITASHNPKGDNGIKFVLSGARPPDSTDLAALQVHVIAELRRDFSDVSGARATLDPKEEFADFALALVGLDLLPAGIASGRRVVVSAGNGVGGVAFAPLAQRLERLGFEFIFLDETPDGDFPHGVPNPLSAAFVGRLKDCVASERADLGIGFDGDGDRAGFITAAGVEVTASQVIALLAERLLAAAGPDAVLMRNLCCSRLLVDTFGSRPSVTIVDTPVGHGKIKQLMRHEHYRDRVAFAGEHSGHYFYREFYYVDSGTLTALHMLRLLAEGVPPNGRSLDDVLQPWSDAYAWSTEINYGFGSAEAVRQAAAALEDAFRDSGGTRYEIREDPALGLDRAFPVAADDIYDPFTRSIYDLKLEFDQDNGSGWWFVVRPSGNESAFQLRLNVESWGGDPAAATARHVQDIETVFAAFGGSRRTG